jgi:hypothetical protein
MADGMFMTPQMARQAAIQAGMISPQQMGSQGLLQQVISTMANAGTGVGAGIGGLFGAEYAPERQARMTQEVLQAAGQKYASPAAQAQEAARLFSSMNMPMQAQAMQERYMKLAPMEQAERDKQDVITGRVNRLVASGIDKDQAQRIARDETTYAEMIKPEAQPKKFNFGVEREAEAAARYNQRFEDLTKEQKAEINKAVAEKAKSVARAGVPPSFGDVASTLGKFDKAVEKDMAMYNTADSALKLLDEAATSNNPSAWEAARTQVAKAVGESKLSNEDIRRTGVDPALWSRLKDTLNKAIEGVPTVDTQNQLRTVANILKQTSGERINKEASRYQNVLEILSTGGVPTGEQVYPTVEVPTTGAGLKPIQQAPRRASFKDLPKE